jgi:hypothetical protein
MPLVGSLASRLVSVLGQFLSRYGQDRSICSCLDDAQAVLAEEIRDNHDDSGIIWAELNDFGTSPYLRD